MSTPTLQPVTAGDRVIAELPIEKEERDIRHRVRKDPGVRALIDVVVWLIRIYFRVTDQGAPRARALVPAAHHGAWGFGARRRPEPAGSLSGRLKL